MKFLKYLADAIFQGVIIAIAVAAAIAWLSQNGYLTFR